MKRPWLLFSRSAVDRSKPPTLMLIKRTTQIKTFHQTRSPVAVVETPVARLCHQAKIGGTSQRVKATRATVPPIKGATPIKKLPLRWYKEVVCQACWT